VLVLHGINEVRAPLTVTIALTTTAGVLLSKTSAPRLRPQESD
jgi:hypothetical protein